MEIFELTAPERDFVEIADLEVRYDKRAVRRLRAKARELGADAIIMVGMLSYGKGVVE